MNFDFNYYPRINKDKIILNIYFIDIDLDAYYFFVINNDFSKRHETKIDEGAWENYQLHEIPNLHFKEDCTKMDDISLILIRFAFYQTNAVFKFKPVFIGILDSLRFSALLCSNFL